MAPVPRQEPPEVAEAYAFIELWNADCARQISPRTRTDLGREETLRHLAEKRAKA